MTMGTREERKIRMDSGHFDQLLKLSAYTLKADKTTHSHSIRKSDL